MLAKINQLLPQSNFFRNVFTLMSGSVIAQAIPIIIAPLLTRLYTPEDFGVFALYTTITSLVIVAITGTYAQAIILPKEDGDAINLVVLAILIATILSILTLFIILSFGSKIAQLLSTPEIAPWLYLLPFSLFLSGVQQSLTYWSNRKSQYRRLAVSRVFQTLTAATLNLSLGLMGAGASGLIIASVAGQSMSTAFLGRAIYFEDKIQLSKASKSGLRQQAIKYKDFPKFTLFHNFLDSVKDGGVVLLISFLFTTTNLGYYAFSMRMLKIPLGLIGSAVAQVFYQQASALQYTNRSIWPYLKKVLLNLTLLSIPIFILIFLFGPLLFSWVFGPEWETAGRYTQLLAPWLLINFISSPISSLPPVLSKQKSWLVVGLIYNILIPMTFLVTAQASGHNIEQTLQFVSLVASLYLVGVIIWLSKLSIRT